MSTTLFFAINETQTSPNLDLSSHPITAVTCICQPPSSGEHNVTLEIHLKVLEQLSVIPSDLISLQWKWKQSITNVSDPQNAYEKNILKGCVGKKITPEEKMFPEKAE